jgi:alkylation response protein AidB-like acyl-CoA dehydrogenase/electron transfer flavoprotein alpha/beta subunit
VQFTGLFQDEEARDSIGKFGTIKKMLAEMSAGRFLIETLDHAFSPTDFSADSENRACLVKALVAECLGTRPGSLAYNAGQIFGGTGYSEDDVLSKFYRDAAAWRFLGVANSAVFRRHGKDLLDGRRGDNTQILDFAHEVDLFDQITQRKALQAELEEARSAESRLECRISEFQEKIARGPAAKKSATVTDNGHQDANPETISALVEEALGRWDAERLASKALLLRTHARLEAGLTAQLEIVLLRVWLGHSSISQDVCEGLLRRLLTDWSRDDRPIVSPAVGPPVASYADFLAAPAPYDSGDFLVKPVNPAQPRMLPELVELAPVLMEHSRAMRALLSDHFGKPRQVPGPTPLGFDTYERYIEHQHRPDAADLDFCRRHGFFRMTIPEELGGEGRPKIDYYLLTTNAQRLADVAISLTIQVNTSIGTTPVLLARDKDLPKAVKDLEGFLSDSTLQREIHAGLERLLKWLAISDSGRVTDGFRDLQDRLAKSIFPRTVLRNFFHGFGEKWSQAAKARQEDDQLAMQAHLRAALEAWKDACNRSKEYQEELTRRRQACDQFLQWVSSGQISAFALTEPSAGSDTARLATRARIRSVPVEEQADGSFPFLPVGGKEHRVLLDAQRVEFPGRVPHYRWSAAANPAPLRFDEYDYETDAPKPQRYYEANGKKVYFTDIAQLRSRNGQLWYDYWELTGAKMWITNGRMAGVMCLYAKTEEGVTGFMVDRHAEGLIVGKDEAKMGQCGSPTNELALQAVRVPRENVIGLEGRGQVNALESLNVGRAGLAMAAMAPMTDLIESSRDFAQLSFGEIPAWVEWRLERMQEDCFITEALAYEIVGRFEHPETHSLRMESAIAKMLTTELLHDVIEYAEEIHGLAGQTEFHLVEKRKRDARVLTIYEGTNEIQRFFILKDLAGEVAPRWADPVGPLAPNLGREAIELEALKLKFRQRLNSALELFDQELWQDASLQANCFLLSEAAAWLKAAESTLARLAWLDLTMRMEDGGSRIEDRESSIGGGASKMEPGEGEAPAEPGCVSVNSGARQGAPAHPPRPPDSRSSVDPRSSILDPRTLVIGRRALTRSYDEIAHRLKRFDEELMHLRRGYYAPEIRAASLLLREEATPARSVSEECRPPLSRVELDSAKESAAGTEESACKSEGSFRRLSILVVVQPTAEDIPHPQVINGRLVEPFLPISESSRSALEAALRIRNHLKPSSGTEESEEPGGTVTIQVVAVGARGCASVLREPLSLGVDRVRLIVPDTDAVAPASAAAAMAAALDSESSFDLILGGETPDDQEDGLPVRLLAQAWNIPFAGCASQVTVGQDGKILLTDSAGRGRRLRSLPAAVAIDKSLSLREFSTAGYLSALGKNVELIRWPRKVESWPVVLVEGEQLSASTSDPSESASEPLAPGQAAIHMLQELGLNKLAGLSAPFGGPIEDVANPILLGNDRSRIVGIVAVDSSGGLRPGALSTLKAVRLLATAIRAAPLILLFAPPEESLQRQAVGQCQASGHGDILLLITPQASGTSQHYGQMLIDCWPEPVVLPKAVVGEPWTELAFATLSLRSRNAGMPALRIRHVKINQGKVMLASSRARGKLQTWQTFDIHSGSTPWISLVAEADICDRDTALFQPDQDRHRTPYSESPGLVQRWAPQFTSRFQIGGSAQEADRLLDEVKQEIGVARLADADFIVDVGFGVGNRDGYEAVIEPLERALRGLGVRSLAIGGSRKVTEELHLLPTDRQIGQSGVIVNPRILLAIGISGAPQHLNYIGRRTTIVAFNRDAEAPIMTLNQRQPRPRVFPIVGDLFETVPAFIVALSKKDSSPVRSG